MRHHFLTVTNFNMPSPSMAGLLMPISCSQNVWLFNSSMIHGKCASCEIMIPPGESNGYKLRKQSFVDPTRSTFTHAAATGSLKKGIESLKNPL